MPDITTLKGIIWTCPQNKSHTVRTTFINGVVTAPHCPKCRDKIGNSAGKLCSSGVPYYEDDAGAVKDAAPLLAANGRFDVGQCWKLLVALANGIGVKMGDQSLSTHFCAACQDEPHGGAAPCGCPCHPARAFVKANEKVMEDAA